jgi:CTP:molybdopterin cytidylyltransferase MocA
LILAGGAGRRFGEPKAFAHLPDGRSFLEACVEVMHEAGIEPIGATLPSNAVDGIPLSVKTIRLPKPGLDMFASIKLGLHNLIEDSNWHRLIILPVDHPLINASTIVTLCNQYDCDAAIPTLKGRHGHPIMISRKLTEKIVDGRLPGPTLREVLRAGRACDISVDDPGIRANCNTPQTLRDAWIALHG